MTRINRFSVWDGTQDPLGSDADALFEKLSEDIFSGWDFEAALRRALSRGWREGGDQVVGIEEMMERLRQRRQRQLERYDLGTLFDDIKERLDSVLRLERGGIQRRLDATTDDAVRRLGERIAGKRREQLDRLPADPGGAIRALHDYEFTDPQAEKQFHDLVEALQKQVVDSYFKNVTAGMEQLSAADRGELREMTRELNALMRRRLNGESAADLQADYDRFRSKSAKWFPDAPEDFDAFLAQLQARAAAMESLMRSLSPEMRREFEEMIAATLDDPELQSELAEFAAALDFLSPRGHLSSRYSFYGDQVMGMDAAMQVMDQLQSLENLERALRGVYQGDELDAASREQLGELLGRDAAQSLDTVARMIRELEARHLVERGDEGMVLTSRGMRRIGQKALRDLFSRLQRDHLGGHQLGDEGAGRDRSDQSKPYAFGDPPDIDVQATVMNAVARGERATPGSGVALVPGDFEVHRTEALTDSATVLMLDMSRSMPLRGYFYAAKKVALALDSLIRNQYPRDALHVVGFSDYAREIPSTALSALSVNEYVYGTNLQHGLILARKLLARHRGANKQIIIISDGEPTAHLEDGRAVFYYPPLPETFRKTLVEVQRCTREHIVINTFMLESNHHLVQFVNQMTRINSGRVFFISPDRLGDYVLVDFVRSRGRVA